MRQQVEGGGGHATTHARRAERARATTERHKVALATVPARGLKMNVIHSKLQPFLAIDTPLTQLINGQCLRVLTGAVGDARESISQGADVNLSEKWAN